jgi:hypothetical protein
MHGHGNPSNYDFNANFLILSGDIIALPLFPKASKIACCKKVTISTSFSMICSSQRKLHNALLFETEQLIFSWVEM